MGSQGMTNWKFIAFFAISLMLIAGLFTNDAIARDGSGTASVVWTSTGTDGVATAEEENFRGSHTLYEHLGAGTGLLEVPLPAGSRENQLMFSYFVDVNMAGGTVEIRLPSGWMIHKSAENIKGKDDTGDADSITDGDAYESLQQSILG